MMSSRSSRLCALFLALSTSFAVSPTWARPEATPSEIGVARRLFAEGKAAEDAGQFRVAAEKFRRAASIKDTPGIRFHLARCEEEQGAFVEALVEYDRARELLDSGMKAADVEKLLPGARERALAKVAQLTVLVPADAGDVRVELDGKPLSGSVLGVPLPINPGKHRLIASAAGRADYTSDIQLGSGEGLKLQVKLAMAPKPTETASAGPPSSVASTSDAPPEVAPKPRSASTSTKTIVLVSEATLVAAGVTTGIIFTVLRSAAQDRQRTANQAVLADVGDDPSGSACSRERPPAPCADLVEAGQDRTRAGNLAAAGFITAGVSAAAFGLTYWLWPESSAPASARASVTPLGVALSLSGRF